MGGRGGNGVKGGRVGETGGGKRGDGRGKGMGDKWGTEGKEERGGKGGSGQALPLRSKVAKTRLAWSLFVFY